MSLEKKKNRRKRTKEKIKKRKGERKGLYEKGVGGES